MPLLYYERFILFRKCKCQSSPFALFRRVPAGAKVRTSRLFLMPVAPFSIHFLRSPRLLPVQSPICVNLPGRLSIRCGGGGPSPQPIFLPILRYLPPRFTRSLCFGLA